MSHVQLTLDMIEKWQQGKFPDFNCWLRLTAKVGLIRIGRLENEQLWCRLILWVTYYTVALLLGPSFILVQRHWWKCCIKGWKYPYFEVDPCCPAVWPWQISHSKEEEAQTGTETLQNNRRFLFILLHFQNTQVLCSRVDVIVYGFIRSALFKIGAYLSSGFTSGSILEEVS